MRSDMSPGSLTPKSSLNHCVILLREREIYMERDRETQIYICMQTEAEREMQKHTEREGEREGEGERRREREREGRREEGVEGPIYINTETKTQRKHRQFLKFECIC
jgi:hypothetical protein